jgi:hypothetical protein
MSDVGQADAGGAIAEGAPAPIAPAMESYGEAATSRLAELKNSAEWRSKYLAGGAREREEFRGLHELAYGQGRDDAANAALAASIGLQPRASLALAERAKASADAVAADLAPNLGEWGRGVGADVAARTTAELSQWVKGLPLSHETGKALLQHVANEGAVPRTDEQRLAWLEGQDKILLDTAHGDRTKVDTWRAQANKALAGSKWTLDNAFALNSAWSIRMLAIAGANKGS